MRGTINDPDALRVDLTGYTVPAAIPTAPYPPSPVEAKYYYYGLPSQPILVARSSTNVWVEPIGSEAYILPKELGIVSHSHPLGKKWDKVGPALIEYLDSKKVEWTSLDPLRIGPDSDRYPVYRPAIVWIGVTPGSLSAEDGVEVVTHCKRILVDHNIYNVQVEIRESIRMFL